MSKMTIVIHGCTIPANGIEVLVTGETVTYYPPARMGPGMQDAFANFGIEWWEGHGSRDVFIVKIEKGIGKKHFSLVLQGDSPQTARVGLRPYKGDQPDPSAQTLWAQQNVHPRDWIH